MWDLVGTPVDRFSHNEAHCDVSFGDVYILCVCRVLGLTVHTYNEAVFFGLSKNDDKNVF